MTRLSCQRFLSNEVRLWLSVIAYDLGNLWRRLVLWTQWKHVRRRRAELQQRGVGREWAKKTA